MSYAIVRNEKLTRAEAQGRCVHNDRKAKKHTNKDIDPERTHLNFYFKKNELNYVKEFDKLKQENNLQGHIRSNSIIMCEMVFTSDKEFFDKIGDKETKRYFEESYKFVCNYKNLGEKNIVSAVVHLDEGTPHMHLTYIPVIHSKDNEGNNIEKICCRDFWKGRDSYRKLQNEFHEYVTSKGFELERGLPIEETGAKNLRIEDLKKVTNFENTKKVLDNIKLELPNVPDIADINRFTIKRDEKIIEEIIKPKDNLIQDLYQDNLNLHRELTKQAKIVKEAEKYQKERNKIIADNEKLKIAAQNIIQEYQDKYNNVESDLKYEYKYKFRKLEKENKQLHKIIDKFKDTTKKFIKWICHKFDLPSEDEVIRGFERDTHTLLDAEKQVQKEDREKEWYLER